MPNLHAILGLCHLRAVTAVEQAKHGLVFQRCMDLVADVEPQVI